MVNELGLARRPLLRVRIHDTRETRGQRRPIRPLPRRVRSLYLGMGIHKLELLISLQNR